jgi:hypothetical protein
MSQYHPIYKPQLKKNACGKLRYMASDKENVGSCKAALPRLRDELIREMNHKIESINDYQWLSDPKNWLPNLPAPMVVSLISELLYSDVLVVFCKWNWWHANKSL